jgi:transposase
MPWVLFALVFPLSTRLKGLSEFTQTRRSNNECAQLIVRYQSVGARVWFLPPYSPDLNPIEKMWSKIKQFLRSAKARTMDALIKSIADALEIVSSQDAAAWFMSCGYQSTKY